ncbi:MAG: helix-turn-helix domain-containing protein [bacterium]
MKTNGNRKEAAKFLGISDRTMYYKLVEYGIK